MIQIQKLKLLNAWRKNVFEELSRIEIMKRSGKNSKPWVFNALNLLIKNRLILLRKKGNLNLYKLNLANPFMLQTFQFLDAHDSFNFSMINLIQEAIENIPIHNYCLLVFGSYAEKTYRKDSDLDICFLIEDKKIEKKIKPFVNDLKLDYTVNIDEHYITFSEFVEMLLRKEENLGKQIFRKNKLFFNSDIYYQLIKEAYKHGFRP